MACPECGSDDLVTEFEGDVPSVVCYSCGTPVEDPSKENANMEDVDFEEDEDDDNGVGSFLEDVESTEALKHSAGDDVVAASSYNQNVKEKSSRARRTSWSRAGKIHHPSDSEKVETVEVRRVASVPTCESCGGTNLVHDSIYETEHLICEDCGAFSEKQELIATQDFTTIAGSSAVYQWSRAPGPKFMNVDSQINKGKVYGAQTIRSMSSQLNWQTYLSDQAVSSYEQLYPHKLVKYTTNSFKDALCVACMYSVARENKVKVTLKSLIALKSVKTKFVTRALKLLKTISKSPLAHQTVSSLTYHVLASCEFDSKFLNKVSKLVDVCEKGFVTQGRDHSHVVTAVAHLVWITEDYQRRKSVSLTRFCSQYKLQCTRHFHTLQKHIKDLFMTLARQLPWVSTPIKGNNYLHYLDSIATYGLSTISRASRPASVTGNQSPDSAGSPSSTAEEETSTLPPLAPPSMRFRSGERSAQMESPPALPAHLTAADLDKEDLEDAEFSDEEIDSYILSSSEAQCKETLTKKDMAFHLLRKKQA